MTKFGTFDVKVIKPVIPVKGLEGVMTSVPSDTTGYDCCSVTNASECRGRQESALCGGDHFTTKLLH